MPLEANRDLVDGERASVLRNVGEAAPQVLVEHGPHLVQLIPLRRPELWRVGGV